MTPLRQKMVAAMVQRGYSLRTHESYIHAVRELAGFFHRSPDRLKPADIQTFFNHLVQERDLSGATCRVYLHGIRFLYLKVLEWPAFDVPVVIPKSPQRIPDLLTRKEVARIIAAKTNPKHRMLLLTCYGCGLRVSELVAIKIEHLDGERHLLRVVLGKGAKDRSVIVSETLLHQLRAYWSVYRPPVWLFPGQGAGRAISVITAERVFTSAKRCAGISKDGGIHSLRHAYATHQLEGGLPVYRLQLLLGHTDIRTTLRYVHWVPNYHEGRNASVDLIAGLEYGGE